MCEYAFPIEKRQQLLRLLSDDSAKVSYLDKSPIQGRRSTWQRVEVVEGAAKVSVVLSTKWMMPENIVVAISVDIRRIFRPFTWRPDRRLYRVLCAKLRQAGGLYLGDGKG